MWFSWLGVWDPGHWARTPLVPQHPPTIFHRIARSLDCVISDNLSGAGYSKEEGQQHPYPVLYCNDGQNVFGDCQTLSGNSWRVAQTAADLISTGSLPPFLVVGLDHAGPLRSLEYTPYTPGTGPGGFRWGDQLG